MFYDNRQYSPSENKLFDEIGIGIWKEREKDQIYELLERVDEPFIHDYVQNTQGKTHITKVKATEIYKINQSNENDGFRKDLNNRRYLWHGTKSENISKILLNGFNIALGRDTALYGKGVYFSDCVTKSAGYANGYMFLAEVALGKMKLYKKGEKFNGWDSEGADSSYGRGIFSPQPEKNRYTSENVLYCPGPLEKFDSSSKLQYNEFIVYNTRQIRLKYLVKFEKVEQNEEEETASTSSGQSA